MARQKPRPGCEMDKYGNEVGRDPRTMTQVEFRALGHSGRSPLSVIRARCLDCCGYQPSEVLKCVATDCANWDYRMGTNPHRKARTQAQQDASKQQGQRLHSQGVSSHENAGLLARDLGGVDESPSGAPTSSQSQAVAGVNAPTGKDDGACDHAVSLHEEEAASPAALEHAGRPASSC